MVLLYSSTVYVEYHDTVLDLVRSRKSYPSYSPYPSYRDSCPSPRRSLEAQFRLESCPAAPSYTVARSVLSIERRAVGEDQQRRDHGARGSECETLRGGWLRAE